MSHCCVGFALVAVSRLPRISRASRTHSPCLWPGTPPARSPAEARLTTRVIGLFIDDTQTMPKPCLPFARTRELAKSSKVSGDSGLAAAITNRTPGSLHRSSDVISF